MASSSYGNSISDYEVYDVIGHGGFSIVHRATSKSRRQDVAIKHIAKDQGFTPEEWKRVHNELEIHIQLIHPYVIPLYAVFQDDYYIYIVLELFDEDLDGYMKRYDLPGDVKRVKEIFYQIVSALNYLHTEGIIHRDLKPGNILLRRDGALAKICDFGLAAKSKEDRSMKGDLLVKSNSTFCGTPDFMAPEMFGKTTKTRSIDESADIWSLGVLLYTMLTGERPFRSFGKTVAEIAKERTSSSSLDFTKIKDTLADDLLRHTLCQRIDDRYSAQQILKHPWLSQIAEEKRKMMSSINGSIDSGNGSDLSNTSPPYSRCRNPSVNPSRGLGVITENSISGLNLTMSTSNFASLDRKKANLDVSRSSGISKVRKDIIPVDVKHLKAMRIQVGELLCGSILAVSSEVVIELLRASTQGLFVTDVTRISANGEQVIVYEPAAVLLRDTPPPVPLYAQTFNLTNLSPKAQTGYELARVFLDVAKSKTVKHWICTDKARSNLMRNEPHPNVESNFYDGITFVHGSAKIQIKKDEKCIQTLPIGKFSSQELKPELRDHWEHHVWCREYLLERDHQTRQLEKNSLGIKILAMGYGRKPTSPAT